MKKLKKGMILTIVLAIALGTYRSQADLHYEYFEGSIDNLSQFDSLTLVKTGTDTETATDPNSFKIVYREQDEYIGFRFTGYIEAATTGDYTFYTHSDDGSALYIGNSLVVNNDGLHGMAEKSGRINLSAGKHAITVTYFNKTGGYGLVVSYAGPGISKTMIPHSILSLSSDQTSLPLPAHESRGVGEEVVLQWQPPTSAPGATYDIYFGTDPDFTSGPVETNYSGTTYPVADVAEGTTYYWRTDVSDPPATGNRWNFTTHPAPLMLFRFEGDPNDSSGNGHHGVFLNGAKIVVDDIRGNVLSLDGWDDFMGLVNPKTAADLGIGGNHAKSMATWVNTRSFNDGGIFDVGAHSNGQEFCLRTLNAADNLWRIQYYGGSYDIDFITDSKDRWVHFALVHDGAATRMYVNGILIKEAPRVLNTSGNDTFRVGQYGNTCFHGLIDDFSLWDYALSQEEVCRLMPAGDLDTDGDVDVLDLKTLTEDWLVDNTTPVLAPLTLDDMEDYQPGGPFPVPSLLFSWDVYLKDCLSSKATLSVILGEPNAPPAGDQALRIVFDYPVSCDGNDDWLMAGSFLDAYTDLSQYDELRFWKRNHGTGHEDIRWEINLGSNYPSGTIVDEHLVCRIGPFSSTEDPNEWQEVVVDLRNGTNVNWENPYGSIEDVQYIHGILVTAISNTGAGVSGSITVDVDDFRLLDYTPGCSMNPAADLNGDCKLDLSDYAIQAANWLQGVSP